MQNNLNQGFEDFLIRHGDYENDRALVTSTWLNSYYDALPEWCNKYPSKNLYMKHNHDKIIEKIQDSNNLLVACNPEDYTHIFGWACIENLDGINVLHYIYIKPAYRKQGIRKVLTAIELKEMTHYTPKGKCLGLTYNPYRWI